jgi:hypothetical protein
LLNDEQVTKAQASLAALRVVGIPIPMRSIPPRPGVASLDDALKVAPDFVLLRTTRDTVNQFLNQHDWLPAKRRYPLDFLWQSKQIVIVTGTQGPNTLMIYDPGLRLEFAFDPRAGHFVHGCHEYPAAGLQLIRAWEPSGENGTMIERDVRGENIRIGPRG